MEQQRALYRIDDAIKLVKKKTWEYRNIAKREIANNYYIAIDIFM